MNLSVAGLGTALPGTVVSQADALRLAEVLCCRTPEQVSWAEPLYHASGVRQRHMIFTPAEVRDVLEGTRHSGSPFLPTGQDDDHGPSTGVRMSRYEELAPPLALEAARAALSDSGLAAKAITHLVTVSCTGFLAPGVDIALFAGLGLRGTVQRTNVGFMGCHAALNGLRVANSLVRADPSARVLLVAVELCSLHYHYGWDPQKMVANALFADGAAALVGLAGSSSKAWQVAESASVLIPDSTQAMSWRIGDHGFGMTLGRRVPELISRHLRPWLTGWLAERNLRVEDIGSWAVHPGGPKILQAVEESLALPPEALQVSRAILAEYGNMSSPTVLFVLDRLRRMNAARPCVALGFGPGLAAEATLFA